MRMGEGIKEDNSTNDETLKSDKQIVQQANERRASACSQTKRAMKWQQDDDMVIPEDEEHDNISDDDSVNNDIF